MAPGPPPAGTLTLVVRTGRPPATIVGRGLGGERERERERGERERERGREGEREREREGEREREREREREKEGEREREREDTNNQDSGIQHIIYESCPMMHILFSIWGNLRPPDPCCITPPS